jgi:pheromone shutdown-related protein TraB
VATKKLPPPRNCDYTFGIAMSHSFSGNVTPLHYQGKTIYLIGTAHISAKSAQEVQSVIRTLRPNTVCVELDASRHAALTDEHRFRKLNLVQVLRENKAVFTLASLILTAYQHRLGEKLGVKPGAELLAGVTAAAEVNARLVLADRNVAITLKRSWANLGAPDRAQLLMAMLASLFGSGTDVSEEQIEALKERDTISEMMGELAKHMPRLQIPLIDERDRYLMSSIAEAEGPVIVGVVGAGHVAGMVKYLGVAVDRAALCTVPAPTWRAKLKPWILPLFTLLALVLGWQHVALNLPSTLLRWCVPPVLCGVVLLLLCRAHVLTTLVSAVLAPVGGLLPSSYAMRTAGMLQLKLRAPTMPDYDALDQALLSTRSMIKNPVTRVLFVSVASAIGARVGAWVALIALVVALW